MTVLALNKEEVKPLTMVEKKDSEKGAKDYGAEKIKVLEGLEGRVGADHHASCKL